MTRGRLILALVVSATAVVLGWALWPRPMEVEIMAVDRGTLVETVTEDGRTRVRNRYDIAAPVDGSLLRSALRPGDPVHRGDVVGTIVPPSPPLLDARSRRTLSERVGIAEAEYSVADADFARAEAERQQAEAEALRAIGLAERDFISKQELERRQLALVRAERLLAAAMLRREAANHQRREARAALEASADADGAPQKVVLEAPVDGRVLRVLVESETPVRAGTPILEIGDPDDIEVVVEVLSEDAVRISPGARAVVTDWGGEDDLLGVVDRVEPGAFTRVSALGVEEQRVKIVVALEPSGPLALGDAYRVAVSIEVRRLEDALLVPTGALFRSGAGFAAYKVDNGIVRMTPVEVVGREGAQSAISSGLSETDLVVVFPPPGLAEGTAVQPLP